MKTVGILDAYISNFHANTYDRLFREIAAEDGTEEYRITAFYAPMTRSSSTGETTEEWARRTGAAALDSPEAVCEQTDVLMILAPNNPELHEDYCRIAFRYGKPVYVDKTFAPDYATACRIAAMGRENSTNYWSTSATRFEPSVAPFLAEQDAGISKLTVQCGVNFDIYSIHLVELMNTFMKEGAESVLCRSNTAMLLFEVRYQDGRAAYLNLYTGTESDFTCYLETKDGCRSIHCTPDFWKAFCRELLAFFAGKKAPVPVSSTLECIAVRSAMRRAMECPGTPVAVERAN